MVCTRLRRLAALGAALLAAVLLLSGCISGQQAGAGGAGAAGAQYSGQVEWWTINVQKNYSAYVNRLISTYQSAHPGVKIKWVDVPGQDITTKLLAAIAGNKVPDAVNFTSFTTGLFASNMTDLSQFFSPQDLSAYAPALASPLKDQSGRQIAIPWYKRRRGPWHLPPVGADQGRLRPSEAADQLGRRAGARAEGQGHHRWLRHERDGLQLHHAK